MSVSAKVGIPVIIWLAVGMFAVQQGRRMVQAGYEIGRLKSQTGRIKERNRQLAMQGSKLKSPGRVLKLAARLGLKQQMVKADRIPIRAGAPARAGDVKKDVHIRRN